MQTLCTEILIFNLTFYTDSSLSLALTKLPPALSYPGTLESAAACAGVIWEGGELWAARLPQE